jgi:hypothetical protein
LKDDAAAPFLRDLEASYRVIYKENKCLILDLKDSIE